MDRERDVERYLVGRVERMGGMCMKFVSPGNDGVPDRIVILPGGVIVLVELKARHGRLNSIQRWQQGCLKRRDVDVRTVWSREQVDEMLKEVMPYEVRAL